MSPRAFPSAALWACLGLVAIADAVAMAAGGFRLVGYGALWIAAVTAGAWSLGYFYSTARPDERLAALGFGAAYLILFTFSAGTLSYVGTSLNRPLLDSAFGRADAALGLDWMATLAFTDARPVLGKMLRLAYQSSLMQIVAVVTVLAVSRQLPRLRGFLPLVTAPGLFTNVSSLLPPAP